MRMLRFLPLLFLAYYSCPAQNGPSKPSAVLSWTQSTTPGVTLNNVYRCTQVPAGTACVPAPPAIFTSAAPLTSWTDATVAVSTDYDYAVTATVGITESGYSNVVAADIPAAPAPPALSSPATTAKREAGDGSLHARVEWAPWKKAP